MFFMQSFYVILFDLIILKIECKRQVKRVFFGVFEFKNSDLDDFNLATPQIVKNLQHGEDASAPLSGFLTVPFDPETLGDDFSHIWKHPVTPRAIRTGEPARERPEIR